MSRLCNIQTSHEWNFCFGPMCEFKKYTKEEKIDTIYKIYDDYLLDYLFFTVLYYFRNMLQ